MQKGGRNHLFLFVIEWLLLLTTTVLLMFFSSCFRGILWIYLGCSFFCCNIYWHKKEPANFHCQLHSLEGDGSVAHATRGRDRRQEGGECSYYNLHCNLNKTLLHTLLLSPN